MLLSYLILRILAGKSHGRRGQVATVHGSQKLGLTDDFTFTYTNTTLVLFTLPFFFFFWLPHVACGQFPHED